jgi:hypothetical protein
MEGRSRVKSKHMMGVVQYCLSKASTDTRFYPVPAAHAPQLCKGRKGKCQNAFMGGSAEPRASFGVQCSFTG